MLDGRRTALRQFDHTHPGDWGHILKELRPATLDPRSAILNFQLPLPNGTYYRLVRVHTCRYGSVTEWICDLC
jgi:hypothetical protein